MPRPSLINSVPTVVPPLNLEEVKFWLHIMAEHALFIKAGLPCGNADFIDEAQAFYRDFDILIERAERVPNEKKFAELVADAYDTVKEFLYYKRKLLDLAINCKLGGHNYPLFLDHLVREAEYVLRLLDKMKNGQIALQVCSVTHESVFWLRLMADHSMFIRQLLDPSERNLISTAEIFTEDFDALFLQGRDFVSMLRNERSMIPAYSRFIKDVRAETLRLRDFKKAARDLIAQCKILGIIPELMADHVRREADHFLMILTMIEKGMINCFSDDEHLYSISDSDEGCVEQREETDTVNLFVDDEWEFNDDSDVPETEFKQEIVTKICDEDDDDGGGTILIPSKTEVPPYPPAKPTKYKWGGLWPRPLGKSR